MSTLCIDMHFGGDASLPQCRIVNERVLDGIDRIVLRLEQERRRRLAGYANIWIQHQTRLRNCEMPRIECYREIGAAALAVGGIHRRIETLVKVRAYRGDHMATCRKADHPDPLRIDMPIRGVEAHQSQRPLR